MAIFSPIFTLKGEISQSSFFQKVGGYFAWKMVLNSYNGSAIVWEGVWKCHLWYSTYTPLSHPRIQTIPFHKKYQRSSRNILICLNHNLSIFSSLHFTEVYAFMYISNINQTFIQNVKLHIVNQSVCLKLKTGQFQDVTKRKIQAGFSQR